MLLRIGTLLAVLGSVCSSAIGNGFDSGAFTLEFQKNLGQVFPLFLSNQILNLVENGPDPITPFLLLPDLPDPLPLEGFSISIDEDSYMAIFGDLRLCNASIVGLSTVTDEIEEIILPDLIFVWRVDVDTLTLAGLYDVNFNVYDGDYVVEGTGEIRIHIVDLVIKLGVRPRIPAWNRIGLNPFTVDVRFGDAEIFLEDFVVNGEVFDWTEFNSFLKPSFEGVWPGAKIAIAKALQDQVNGLLMECKVFDLLNENFGCFSANNTLRSFLSSVKATMVDACPAEP